MISRILSLVIGIGEIWYFAVHAGARRNGGEGLVATFEWGLPVAVAVVLIWFPEQIGAITGFVGHGMVDQETPGAVLSFFGWLVLVALPVVAYFLR